MIQALVRAWRDLFWLRMARRALGVVDGMRQGAGVDRQVEIVVPRWWDLARWLVWLRCEGTVESTFGRPGGGFVYLVLRARPAPVPKALPIRLPSGRTIVPRPPPSGITGSHGEGPGL